MRRLKLIERPRSQVAGRMTSNENERGAAAVVVAFSLVVLLGFTALAVDVGAMYAEKAQLQTGADATALAIAGDCAKGLNCSTAMAADDNRLADDNANDGSSGTFSVTQPTANSVRVETNAQAAGSTDDSFTLFFARVLGNDSAVIHAAAVATWGTPSEAKTLPWTISECVFKQFLSPTQLADFNSTGTFTGDPVPTRILFRYDQNVPTFPGCAADNGYAPGGFGWLDTDSGCSTDIDVANSEVGSNPGNDLPHVCDDMPATIKDSPILIPVFTTATQNGQKTRYELSGFLAFQVTGFKFGGGPGLTDLDPLAPNCNGGNCRGIQGYFTRFVSLTEGLSLTGGIPNYGATVVALSE
jgi:Flp pilus assembly protein TadG